MTFNEWLKAVDAEVTRLTFGLGIHDLPDIPYHDLYDDGVTPQVLIICNGFILWQAWRIAVLCSLTS